MNNQFLEELLDELLTNRITPQGAKQLVELIDDPQSRAKLEAILEARFMNDHYEIAGDPKREEVIKQLLLGKTYPTKRKVLPMIIRFAAAAVILFAVAGAYFLLRPKQEELLSQTQRFKNDVAPGRTGAILTIEGGKSILLDTASNGNILGHFVKGDSSLSVQTATAQYATLSTPAAHTEVLKLKDGTTVYLNASSSIRFPTVFSGAARIVEITGEAYFEVAHNASQPFKVKVSGQVIEDIGTAFNVNAYENEKVIRTTLVEGSVRVTNNAKNLLLKPGEQSQADQSGNLKLVSNPDMDETLAWKNGIFRYNGTGIESIMKQVTRWYGVEVIFQDSITEEFVAKIPRDVPVSELLNLLEGTNHVHFLIEGKKITVMK